MIVSLGYEEIEHCVRKIYDNMVLDDYEPDYIIGISRGGLIPAVMLSHIIDVPLITTNLLYSNTVPQFIFPHLNQAIEKKYLVIDDINDTGETFKCVSDELLNRDITEVKYAVLCNKKMASFKIDYMGTCVDDVDDNWIIFPWET